MKHEEQFDELARWKLAQRGFTFDEAHWEGVHAALDAQRKRRPAAWLWAAALLLVGGGALWYGTQEDSTMAGTQASPGTVEVEGTKSVQAARTPVQVDAVSTAAVTTATEAVGGTAGTRAQTTGGPTEKTVEAVGSAPAPAPVAASEKRSAPLAQNATTNAATLEVNAGLLTVADRPLESGINEDLSGAGTNIESKQDARSATNGMDQTGVLEEPLQVAPPPNAEPVTVPQDGAHQLEVAAAPEAGIELVDSNAVVVATTSLDSAVVPDVIQPPSKRPGPLEATLWAGPSWANNKYSGGTSTEWIGGVSGEQAWDLGGELMVMRRNFGVGLGVHYASYKERFSQDEVLRHQQELRNSYFFNTIDTTVTIVIDTVIQNDTMHFVTQQVNTTINVLDWTTDTTVTTIREREAVATRNVASYFEIPLLLDAHLAQGRWRVGLRGGPTVGILSGHRGPLPGSSDGGTVPFTDMVFGYTARAYVRYSLGTAWSIGIEPGVRGHFGNALGSGDVIRHSSSMGVLFGLSYRFR
ncbi:MAG: hypothetical protein IPJ76_13510 [Flavobacteriales bacterium]|nr:MAG: hypothetical protein IPJ76_13510 [Flavobacteriales bacterium]